MAVLPTDRDLEHEMQVVEPDGDGHLDAADHRWRHLVDLDLEPRDVGHARHVGLARHARHAVKQLVCGAEHPRLPYAQPSKTWTAGFISSFPSHDDEQTPFY